MDLVAGGTIAGAEGVWHARGGHGQEVAQQSGLVWQHLAAHSAVGTALSAAGAKGAATMPNRIRINAANLTASIYTRPQGRQIGQSMKSQATSARIGSRKGSVKRTT